MPPNLEQTGVELVTQGFTDFINKMEQAGKAVLTFKRRVNTLDKLNLGALQNAGRQIDRFALSATKIGSLNFAPLGTGAAALKSFSAAAVLLNKIDLSKPAAQIDKFLASLSKMRSGAPAAATFNDLNNFANLASVAVAQLTQGINQLNGSLAAVATRNPFLATGAGGIVNTLGGMAKGATTAGAGIGGLLKKIVALGTAIYVVKRAFDAIGRVIQQFTGMMARAAENVQILNIRIQNLVARQIRMVDETETLSSSMDKASGISKDLLHWISELAAATPFDVDIVGEMTSLSIAMGWSVEGAKELTEAMLNYTAGTGLGNEITERLIYNFAQLRQQGKLTGTEIRDLGRGAFLNVTEILKVWRDNVEMSTMSLQEFEKAASTGAIPIEGFFDAFVEWAGTNFPNAARRMNFTMAALKDNLRDFVKVILGWDVLAPVVANFAARASASLGKLFSPESRRNSQLLGIAINDTFNSIVASVGRVTGALKSLLAAFGLAPPSIETIIKAFVLLQLAIDGISKVISGFVNRYAIPFVKRLREALGGGLVDIARKALNWGINITYQLAAGLVKGAAKFVAAALKWIGGLITKWLAPGSPPLLLPELTEWGAQAMAEYLRGFTQIDFSVLDSVQDAVSGALEALADLGMIAEESVGDTFVEISESLIRAMDELNRTGEISAGIFEQLRSIGGGFGDEIAKLLQNQLAYADAVEDVAAAEDRLKKAQENTSRQRGRVRQLTREYNELLRSGASQAELQKKLAELNAEEVALSAATKEEAAAEEALKVAEDRLDPLKEAVDLQEQLIKQLIELAQAQAKLQEDEDGGGGGGEEAAPDVEEPVLEIPEVDTGGLSEDLGAVFDKIKADFLAQLSGIWDGIKEAWGAALTRITARLKEIWDGFAKKLGLPTWDEIAAVWADFDGSWASFIANLKETWDLFADKLELSEKFDRLREGIKEKLSPITDWINNTFVPAVQEAWDGIVIWWEGVWSKVSDYWEGTAKPVFETVWKVIKGTILAFVDTIGPKMEGFLASLRGIFDSLRDAIGRIDFAAFLRALLSIGQAVGAVIGFIRVLLTAILTGLVGGLIKAVNMVAPAFSMIFDGIVNFLNGIFGIINSVWQIIVGIFSNNQRLIQGGWKKFKTAVVTVVVGLVQAVVGLFLGLFGAVIGFVSGFFESVVEFFQNLYNRLVGDSIIPELVEGIIKWFKDLKIKALRLIREWVQQIVNKVIELKDNFVEEVLELKNKAVEIFENIRSSINEKVEAVRSWIHEKLNAIKSKWDEIWDSVSGKATEIWNSIHTFVTGKIEEVRSGIETKVGEIKSKWDTTWDEIKGKIDEIMLSITTAISTEAQKVYDNFIKPIQDLITDLPGYVTDFFNIGADLIMGLVDGIASMVSNAITSAVGLIQGIISAVKGEAESKSPSKVFAEIGADMMRGLAMGIDDFSLMPTITATQSVQQTIAAATVSAPPVMSSHQVTFGDTIINSGMDEALFKQRVIKVISEL